MIKYNEFWGQVISTISLFLPLGKRGAKIRGSLYRPFFKKVGKDISIPARTYIYNPNKLSLGDNVWLGYNSYYGEGEIEIGDNVVIGPFVSVTASNHNRINGTFRFTGYTAKKIVIEKNVWIGAHSCILAGVTVEEGALVAAGSVVNKKVKKNMLVGGVPAKKIKELN